jgi:hypothetical protein
MCEWQTMDIGKMSTRDASFSAPFKLVATRNDFIHALVAYFDVMFSKCHKTTGFSTGLSWLSLLFRLMFLGVCIYSVLIIT